jgi:hypothetical protein
MPEPEKRPDFEDLFNPDDLSHWVDTPPIMALVSILSEMGDRTGRIGTMLDWIMNAPELEEITITVGNHQDKLKNLIKALQDANQDMRRIIRTGGKYKSDYLSKHPLKGTDE